MDVTINNIWRNAAIALRRNTGYLQLGVMPLARCLILLTLGGWATVIAVSPSPAAGQSVSLDASQGFVFTGASAVVLGRTFFLPEDLGATWDPTPSEISQLEQILAVELGERLSKSRGARTQRPEVRDYYRQYAGIHLKDRKLILVNGFHRAHVEHTTSWLAQPRPESELTSFPVAARGENFWHFVPVHVYDGGEGYFLALYDPVAMRIVAFAFNGHA